MALKDRRAKGQEDVGIETGDDHGVIIARATVRAVEGRSPWRREGSAQ